MRALPAECWNITAGLLEMTGKFPLPGAHQAKYMHPSRQRAPLHQHLGQVGTLWWQAHCRPQPACPSKSVLRWTGKHNAGTSKDSIAGHLPRDDVAGRPARVPRSKVGVLQPHGWQLRLLARAQRIVRRAHLQEQHLQFSTLSTGAHARFTPLSTCSRPCLELVQQLECAIRTHLTLYPARTHRQLGLKQYNEYAVTCTAVAHCTG